MKTLSMLIVLTLASVALAQEAKAGPSLVPGDEVSIDAIAAATFIQGQAPTAWEKDKVYLIECWATWCGPCRRVIPHVNELHKKFADQGLRVFGMNVWEDGQEKVANFVKQQGQHMSYTVAYVGRGGAFEKQWLKAAAVRGIPHAFVVKNGKLLFKAHPASISEEVIAAVLKGGEAEQNVVQQIVSAQKNRDAFRKIQRDFNDAFNAKDADAMAAAIRSAEQVDKNAPFIALMKIEHAILTKDWPAAEQLIGELDDSRTLNRLAQRALPGKQAATATEPASGPFPDSMNKLIARQIAKATAGDEADPMQRVVLAALQWHIGEKDAAKATAAKAVQQPGNYPTAPFEAFVKSFDDGQPQTPREVYAALRAEIKKQKDLERRMKTEVQ